MTEMSHSKLLSSFSKKNYIYKKRTKTLQLMKKWQVWYQILENFCECLCKK